MFVKRAGIHRILALLWSLIKDTISLFQQIPALISEYLLAVIATPFALPHIKIPYFELLFITSLATGCTKSG